MALVWILLAQMFWVCLGAKTTVSLSRLEANYAYSPTPGHNASLQDEFDRVAKYESHRAIGRFTLLLVIDVGLIAFFWNYAHERKTTQNSAAAVRPSLSGQTLAAR